MRIECCAKGKNYPLGNLLVEFKVGQGNWNRHRVKDANATVCGQVIPPDAMAMLPDCWSEDTTYRDCKLCR